MGALYGWDTSTTAGIDGDELDTSGAELDDDRAIAEDILRACSIPTGTLPHAPSDTVDVTGLVGRAMSPAERNTAARSIEATLLRDERYTAVSAVVSYSVATGLLSIRVTGETDTGTFDLQLQQDGSTLRVVKTGE